MQSYETLDKDFTIPTGFSLFPTLESVLSSEEELKVYAINVMQLMGHVSSLDHYCMDFNGMSTINFNKHWRYSLWCLELAKSIMDTAETRKVKINKKETYTPEDQEIVDSVRQACIKIGAFRYKLVMLRSKQVKSNPSKD